MFLLHTPQKLHLFMVPPVKRGMSVVFASKDYFIGQNKIKNLLACIF